MAEDKKSTKKQPTKKKQTTNKETKKEEKQRKINQLEQERQYQEAVARIVENMSPINKLYTIREALDLVVLGKQIDINVINKCFNDLCEDLADYKFTQNELETYNNLYAEMISGVPYNKNDAEDSTEMYYNENLVSPEEYLDNIAGEEFEELQDGIDKINMEDKSLLQINLFPNNHTHTIRIKIMDAKEGILKRVYDDPWDMKLNYKHDLEQKFNCTKLHNIGTRKLSKNKDDNVE